MLLYSVYALFTQAFSRIWMNIIKLKQLTTLKKVTFLTNCVFPIESPRLFVINSRKNNLFTQKLQIILNGIVCFIFISSH